MNSGNKELRGIVDHYSQIISNPKLEGIFTDDSAKGEVFVHKLMKNQTVSNIIKYQKFWVFQAGKFCYVLYRVPQAIAKNEISEISQAIKLNFNNCSSFTLYSLYGIEKEDNNVGIANDIIPVTELDLVKLVNTI